MQQHCERGGEETRETREGEGLQALSAGVNSSVNNTCLLLATWVSVGVSS